MSKEIYVGNPNGVDFQALLHQLSEIYGPIVDAQPKHNFCFVTFSSSESARHAVQDGQMVVSGRRVSLERRKSERSQGSSSTPASDSRGRTQSSSNVGSSRKPSNHYGGTSTSTGSSGSMTKTMYAVYADNVPPSVAMVELQDFFRKCGAESVNWDSSVDGRKAIKILFSRESEAQRLLDERIVPFQGRQLHMRSHAAPRQKSPQPVPPPPSFNDPTDGPVDRRGGEESARGGGISTTASRVNALRNVESLIDSIKSSTMRYKAEDTYEDDLAPFAGQASTSAVGGSNSSRAMMGDFTRRGPSSAALANEAHQLAASVEIEALREQLRQQKEVFDQQAALHRDQRALMEEVKSKLARAEAEELVLKREVEDTRAENNRLTRDLHKANMNVDELRAKCNKLSDENVEARETIQTLKQESNILREGIERLEVELRDMVGSDQPRMRRMNEPMPREFNMEPRGSDHMPRDEPHFGELDAMRRTIEDLAVLRDALRDDSLFDGLGPPPTKRPMMGPMMGDGLLPPPGVPVGHGLLGPVPGPGPMMGGIPSLLDMPRVNPPPPGMLHPVSLRHGGRRDQGPRNGGRGSGGRDNDRRSDGRRGDDRRPRDGGGRDNRRR